MWRSCRNPPSPYRRLQVWRLDNEAGNTRVRTTVNSRLTPVTKASMLWSTTSRLVSAGALQQAERGIIRADAGGKDRR
jgi:hypothetical protein